MVIEASLPDLVDLDPQLSQALSAFPHEGSPLAALAAAAADRASFTLRADAPRAAGGAAAATAAGAHVAPEQQLEGQQQQQQQQQPAQQPVQQAGQQQEAAQQQPQQQGGGGGSLSPASSALRSSPTAPADMQAKWDAFAETTAKVLQVAPSPFKAAAASHAASPTTQPIRGAVTWDPSQLAALRGTAAAAEQQARPAQHQQQQQQAQHQQQSSPAEQAGLAAASGSFQLGAQPSWVPLVDHRPQQQQQQQQGAAGAAAGAAAGGSPGKPRRFLGLFGGRAPDPGRPSPFSGQQAAGGGAEGESGLIQEVPSSHGSSLAAVLSQLGLSDGGASSAAGGSANGGASLAAADSLRRLKHSNEDDGFGSWKTAGTGSGHHGSSDLAGASSSAHSWRTASERQHSAASSGHGAAHLGPRSASQLSSTASGGLPPAAAAAQQHQQPAQALARTPGSARERAASLQEEHLAGFLTSGKEQASRAADQARLGLPGTVPSAGRPGSAGPS